MAGEINKVVRAPNHGGRRGCGPLIVATAEQPRPLKQQIFERVRAVGALPRIQIAKELGISPASVTTITSELIEAGHLEEVAVARDPADSGRGRPPMALGVRRAANYVAGLKLSDRVHTAVIADFAGNLVASEAIEAAPGPVSATTLLEIAADLIGRATRIAGIDPGDLAGVGVGVPGFIDHARGAVLWSPLLESRNTDLASAAGARLGVPVTIDNDANLVALAELWFGAGRHKPDFAVVTIEHGVGMGLVLNHRLYRGARGLGMELGHIKVQLDGALCRCGQRGCLEAYVADYALTREATTALNWSNADGTHGPYILESLFDHAKAGNAAARSIFRRAGRYLAVGLANVVNLFDPELIILSGERMRYDYLHSADALAELDDLILQTGRAAPEIEVQAWGDLLWARGAAALALTELDDRLFSMRPAPVSA